MARLNLFRLTPPGGLAPPPAVEVRPAPEPICRSCTWAFVALGYSGEVQMLCRFGNVLRDLPFAVRNCTDYGERRSGNRVGVGFGAR